MKTFPWILVSTGVLTLGAALGACGNSTAVTTTTGTGGTGTGGAKSTSHSSTTSTSVVTGTGGSGSACADSWDTTTDCGTCMVMSCCKETTDCVDDTDCDACFNGMGDAATCAASALFTALGDCEKTKCDVCIPKSTCNPVTNEGCPTDGSGCDLNTQGVYICFPPPNPALLCQACSNGASGPYCAATLHCTDPDGTTGGKCTSFCCDDGDCGPNGTCDKSFVTQNVGVCTPKTDAGPDAGMSLEGVCDAPAVAPSMGKCFTLPGKDGG
jgi:hypothetical protein